MSDPATVSRLVLQVRHELLAYLYSALPDYHAVEDAFQETCLVAVQKAAEFRDGTNFAAWARAIARHKLREQLRKRTGVLLADAFFDGLDRAFDEARAALDPDPRKEALRLCLAELHDGARQMVSLRYDEGLDPAAIAGRMGKSRAAVNSLLQRIREILRECVDRRLTPVRG
ncbi:MAG TPA: sigma-70 family RNA polymerase sigma factor [Planctomycetota bacterium]|nr:sigma-70 family RNA polymerase sigma factor [Planctomycetota bacterium]